MCSPKRTKAKPKETRALQYFFLLCIMFAVLLRQVMLVRVLGGWRTRLVSGSSLCSGPSLHPCVGCEGQTQGVGLVEQAGYPKSSPCFLQ